MVVFANTMILIMRSLVCVHTLMEEIIVKRESYVSSFKDIFINFNLNMYVNITDKCFPDGKYLCKNGGTCNIKNSGDVVCACKNKYSGKYCDNGELGFYI